MIGLTVETLLLAPFAALYLLYFPAYGAATFLVGLPDYNILLPLSGVITAVPLLFFIAAAQRLQLATIGFFTVYHPQSPFYSCYCGICRTFFSPSVDQFFINLDRLAIYSVDAILKHRQIRLSSA